MPAFTSTVIKKNAENSKHESCLRVKDESGFSLTHELGDNTGISFLKDSMYNPATVLYRKVAHVARTYLIYRIVLFLVIMHLSTFQKEK